MQSEDNEKHDSKPDTTDEARAEFPFGTMYVRGRHAASAFWMIFVIALVAALGWTIPNIINALRQ